MHIEGERVGMGSSVDFLYSPTPGATEFSYWATTDRDSVSVKY